MNDTIIEQVLSASNHYEVLGLANASDATDTSVLRKAYLKRSVQVHPDKNDNDPRATQAFQRVTHAYNVLSNEDSRAAYERHGRRDTADPDNSETYYAQQGSNTPSYQDSMFVFASVASMMNGGGGAADMANAMFFAEQFLTREKVDLSDGKSKAQAAMAAGSTLRVVGSAVRAVGFKKSAAALDTAATAVQVAGLGAWAADTPAVKKALEEPAVQRTLQAGSQKLSQLGGSLAAARAAMTTTSTKGDTAADSKQPQQTRSTQSETSRGGAESATTSSSSTAGSATWQKLSQMGSAARDAMKNRTADASQESTTNSASATTNSASARNSASTAGTEQQPDQQPANHASRIGGLGVAAFSAACSLASSAASKVGNKANGDNDTAGTRDSTASQQQQSSQPQGGRASAAPEDDLVEDHLKKARAAGAAAAPMRQTAQAAQKMGLHKQAADLHKAAQAAEMAGQAAQRVDNNPLLKSALRQPAVQRVVQSGGQRILQEAMKQSTKATK